MKYLHGLLLFSVLALVTVNVVSVHAQECKLCIAKEFYKQGDAIVISGKVDAVLEKTPIIIQIFYGTNIVNIAQVEVSQDGSYTHTVIADGIYWKSDGKYTVKATYGVSGNVYETSFDFQTSSKVGETTQIFEVKAGDSGTFDVPYTIRGGTVKDIIVDPQILGFIITIQSDNDGSLTLDLGRKWIDAKTTTGDDDSFIIYIDGSEVQYQESADADSRILTIQFLEGDSDIEIIGTQVIPEFGSIAVIVLVLAIILAITVSTKEMSLLRIS
ncbi:MAG: PEFG-CTERM sorting domain-containing protein [Thaumarchaeota archaeon]|nr:PEFG-CTERM sorting domain-containing protein [Nitrososphaerota archaeon]